MIPAKPVVVPEVPAIVEEPVLPRDTVRVSWGSIIAGLVVALGAWVLLSVLGLAIGLSAVDPSRPASLKSGEMVSGIWSLIVPFIALLVGGLVAARTAGVVSRPTGAIHGVVLWALATIASLMLVGYVVRGVVSAAMGAAAQVAPIAAGGGGGAVMLTLEIGPDDLIGPVNERLRAAGKPPATPDQIDATLRDASRTATASGRVDRDTFVASLSRHTQLSPNDAEDIATRFDANVSGRAEEMRRDAAQAADTTGKAMWWVFLGMLLGLGSAVVGSTLGVSRRQRLAATAARAHAPYSTPAHSHT